MPTRAMRRRSRWRASAASGSRCSSRDGDRRRQRRRMRLWAPHAWLGGEEPVAGVLVELKGERIASVRAGTSPPAGAERLDGLLLPGLANAHSHAFQRALRARTQRDMGSFWTWRRQMFELAGRLDPDSLRALARAAFAEMALAGITLVGEFHYLHHGPDGTPYAEANAMGLALLAAAEEAGIRLTLLDACYLHGGLEPDPVQRRFFDSSVEAWCERVQALADPRRGGRGSAPPCTACAPCTRSRRRSWPAGRPSARSRCTPTSPSSRPRTRRAGRSTAPPRRGCCTSRERCRSASPPCTPPT